jgi:hypothetical protein
MKFNSDQRVLKTELTISEDFETVEILIQPQLFNLVKSLPETSLITSRRALQSTNASNRVLQLGNIPNADLGLIINSAGGIDQLSSLLNYRTTQFTQVLVLEYFQKSMAIDFSKLLTFGYILGLLLKLAFFTLIGLAILGSLNGINLKSRVLHFWVYTTVLISCYFSTNGMMSPVFRKFTEMIVVGWFSDIFELHLNI